MRRRIRSVALVVCMIGALLVPAIGAMAQVDPGIQDGPTPPALSDPVGTNITPHGGYSLTSQFCLQCHDVHDAAGSYALMQADSVVDTCATCHGYNGNAETGRVVTNFTGKDAPATVSVRSVYTISAPAASHGMGSTTVPGETVNMTSAGYGYGSWQFGGGPFPGTAPDNTLATGMSSATSGGLYCASCHTPHGDYGQLVNDPGGLEAAVEGTYFYYPDTVTGNTQAWWDEDGGNWFACPADTDVVAGVGHGAPCTWFEDMQILDSEGNLVSLYGYKLLSAYPNHSYGLVQSYALTYHEHDVANWCSSCHNTKDIEGTYGAYHNHPTGCVTCHGNADGDTGDFPHTSTSGKFLLDLPDALCISCHTNLP